jgi:hypothetical protein
VSGTKGKEVVANETPYNSLSVYLPVARSLVRVNVYKVCSVVLQNKVTYTPFFFEFYLGSPRATPYAATVQLITREGTETRAEQDTVKSRVGTYQEGEECLLILRSRGVQDIAKGLNRWP